MAGDDPTCRCSGVERGTATERFSAKNSCFSSADTWSRTKGAGEAAAAGEGRGRGGGGGGRSRSLSVCLASCARQDRQGHIHAAVEALLEEEEKSGEWRRGGLESGEGGAGREWRAKIASQLHTPCCFFFCLLSSFSVLFSSSPSCFSIHSGPRHTQRAEPEAVNSRRPRKDSWRRPKEGRDRGRVTRAEGRSEEEEEGEARKGGEEEREGGRSGGGCTACLKQCHS